MGFVKHDAISAIVDISVEQLVQDMRSGALEVSDVFAAYAYMIKNDRLNAFSVDVSDAYYKYVSDSEQRIKNGTQRSLEGLPFAVKANFCSTGDETDACSKILAGYKPDYDAKVVENLRAAGAIMMGKTNMDEFAMGSTNKNSCYGAVVSPWQRDGITEAMIPGGSSGGSAAAVAASMIPFALGSDTGGSVRQPAALCGVVGFKPTYGLCSRWGMVSYASSLDQAGVIARNVRDSAFIMSNIVGYDDRDSTSLNIPRKDYLAHLDKDIRGLRIGVPSEYLGAGHLADDVIKYYDSTIKLLRSRGAEIVEVTLPNVKHSIPVYYILACTEAASNLARYDGIRYGASVDFVSGMDINDYYASVRAKYFGKEVKKRIWLGYYVLSSHTGDNISLHSQAVKVRALIYKEFRSAFEKVDAILSPTTSDSACAINEKMDPMLVYYNDIYTVPANLCGCPAISVPVGLDKLGMPLGMHLIGNRLGESAILNIAAAIEDAVEFKLPRVNVVRGA